MGCICSKKQNKVDESEKEKELSKSSFVQLVAPTFSPAKLGGVGDTDGSVNRLLRKYSQANARLSLDVPLEDKNKHKVVVDGKSITGQYQKCMTLDAGVVGQGKPTMSRTLSLSKSAKGEHVAAGWPLWLSSVAGDAIKGWVPRRLDSFEKLGQVSSNITALFFFDAIFPYMFCSVYIVHKNWLFR